MSFPLFVILQQSRHGAPGMIESIDVWQSTLLVALHDDGLY